MVDVAWLPWWQATGSLQLKILKCLIAVIWLPLLLKGLRIVPLVPSLNAWTNNVLDILFLRKSGVYLRRGEQTWGKYLSLNACLHRYSDRYYQSFTRMNMHAIIFSYDILHTVLLPHNGWYDIVIQLYFMRKKRNSFCLKDFQLFFFIQSKYKSSISFPLG